MMAPDVSCSITPKPAVTVFMLPTGLKGSNEPTKPVKALPIPTFKPLGRSGNKLLELTPVSVSSVKADACWLFAKNHHQLPAAGVPDKVAMNSRFNAILKVPPFINVMTGVAVAPNVAVV